MDFDNNKDENEFFKEEKQKENLQNEHYFNNLEKLSEIRNEVTIPLATVVFTILISLKISKSASFLEEAVLVNDENKLKLYFNEQSKALKLYIIFIIVSIVLSVVICIFMFSLALTGILNHSNYYYNSY